MMSKINMEIAGGRTKMGQGHQEKHFIKKGRSPGEGPKRTQTLGPEKRSVKSRDVGDFHKTKCHSSTHTKLRDVLKR